MAFREHRYDEPAALRAGLSVLVTPAQDDTGLDLLASAMVDQYFCSRLAASGIIQSAVNAEKQDRENAA